MALVLEACRKRIYLKASCFEHHNIFDHGSFIDHASTMACA